MAFHRRLRERKLVQWTVAYLAAAWLAVQVVAHLGNLWGWSLEFQRAVFVLLALGLPLTVVLAWYHGEKGRQYVTGAELLVIATTLGAAGVGMAALTSGEDAAGSGAAEAAPAVPFPGEAAPAGARPAAASVAVLPFIPQATDGGLATLLADGIHGRVVERLARLREVRVLPRTSVLDLAEVPRDARAVAEQLHVDVVVEGSVRAAADSVDVVVRLSEPFRDGSYWTEVFSSSTRPEDVFDLERRLVQRLVRRLSVESEAAPDPARLPTTSLQAYDFYIRGNTYAADRFSPAAARQAVAMYSRAVALDSSFALAWAELGETQAVLFGTFDRTRARREAARAAVQRALAIDPDLPEARQALGSLFYWGHGDFERALQEFEAVYALRPNDPELLWLLASLHRRRDELQRSTELLEEAVRLAPRAPLYGLELAANYQAQGRLPEARERLEVATRLSPADVTPHVALAILHYVAGSPDSARLAVEATLERFGLPRLLSLLAEHSFRYLLHLMPNHALESILSMRPQEIGVDRGALLLTRAEALWLLGRDTAVAPHAESARVVFQARVRSRPEEPVFHAELALAHAHLGDADRAVEAAARAAEFLPLSRDAFSGAGMLDNLLHVQVLTGEHDAAFNTLESMRHLTWRPDSTTLAHHPWFAPLRDSPRFRELLEDW